MFTPDQKPKQKSNRNLQRAARERQARTGEGYATALARVKAEREAALPRMR